MLLPPTDQEELDRILAAVYREMRRRHHWVAQAAREMDIPRGLLQRLLVHPECYPLPDTERKLKTYAWPDVYGPDGLVWRGKVRRS